MGLGLNVLMAMLLQTASLNNPLAEKERAVKTMSAADLIVLGDLYAEAMQFADAKRVYQKAEVKLKKSIDIKLRIAELKIAKGNLKQAKRACRRLAKINRRNPAAMICEGKMWLKFDRSARAEEEFAKVLAIGDVVSGQLGMARVYVLKNEYDKALDAYKKAIDAGADYRAYLGIGQVYELSGNKEKAVEVYKKVVKMQPASCLAHFYLGKILKPGKEAVEHLKIASLIRPRWAELYLIMGNVYLQMRDYQNAKYAFERLISLNSKNSEAYLGLGKVLFQRGEYKKAKGMFKKSIALDRSCMDAHLMLAQTEFVLKNFVEAAFAMDDAVELSPNNPKIYEKAGEMFYKMGRFTKANSYFLQVLSINPHSTKANVFLGDIACRRSLYEQGKRYYTNAESGDIKGFSKAEIENRKLQCRKKH